MEPQINSQHQNVVQATLTLAPQKSVNGSPKRSTVIKQTVKESSLKKQKEDLLKNTGFSRFIVHNNQINEIQMPNPLLKKMDSFVIDNSHDNKNLTRYSASTLADIGNDSNQMSQKQILKTQTNGFSNKNEVRNVSTLPARHSKSLDQLKVSPQSMSIGQSYLPQVQTNRICGMNQCSNSYVPQKPQTLPRNLTSSSLHNPRSNDFTPMRSDLQMRSGSQTVTPSYGTKGDEYRRNINEFREKYKNPCGSEMSNRNKMKAMEIKQSTLIPNCITNVHPFYYIYNNENVLPKHIDNFIHNPLEFQRGYNMTLPRPMLPPRNSYPPVSNKNQQVVDTTMLSNKNIHRSNSTHAFHQRGYNEIDQNIMQNQQQLRTLDFIPSFPYNHSYNDCTILCQNGSKYPMPNDINFGMIPHTEKPQVLTNNYVSPKSPPSTQSGQSTVKHKKNKSKDQTKLHHSAKDLTRVNSSKDSLTSHHSSRSRESKADRSTLKTEKRSSSSSRHKASEKMSQQISEASTSSSNESLPHTSKRLESSASVPYKLDHGQEGLRHCRSAASVLDEANMNNNLFSESLPNLAPPPAFDSPPLDIADEDFKILPPDTFKNDEDLEKKRDSGSTSSLSEQSGWVSSRRSSEPSSPDVVRMKKSSSGSSRSKSSKPNTDGLHTNTLQSKNSQQDNTLEIKRTVLNGEQLRERLLKLAVKVAKSNMKDNCECCCDCNQELAYDTSCIFCNNIPIGNFLVSTNGNSFTMPKSNVHNENNKSNSQFNTVNRKSQLTARHNSFNTVESLTAKQNQCFINGVVKDTAIAKPLVNDGLHPYIRKELPPKVPTRNQLNKSQTLDKVHLKERIEYTDKLLAAEIRSLTMERKGKDKHSKQRQMTSSGSSTPQKTSKSDKCKSEVDLSHLIVDSPYEDLRLPPPQQFRDVPPPPDEFKVCFYIFIKIKILFPY